jgi:hypothetical protein
MRRHKIARQLAGACLRRAAIAAVLATATVASQASAAVMEYRLSTAKISGPGSFWAELKDLDGDALFSVNGMTDPSGNAITGYFAWNAPTLAGYADGGHTILALAAWGLHQNFGAGATTSSVYATLCTYALTDSTPPLADVRLSASALLLVAGGSLAVRGRRP